MSHSEGPELSDAIVKPRLQYLSPHDNQGHRELEHISSASPYNPLLCPWCDHLPSCSSFLRPPREACIVHCDICCNFHHRLWDPPSRRIERRALLWVLFGRDGTVCHRGVAAGLAPKQLSAVWEKDGGIRAPVDGGKCKRDHGALRKSLPGLVGSVINLGGVDLSFSG